MINQYQKKRQTIVDSLLNIQQQLTAKVKDIQQATTVDLKLAAFTQRDLLMEQQRQLQIELSLLDNEEIQRQGSERTQPRFRPADR
jgi:hypothetical protein